MRLNCTVERRDRQFPTLAVKGKRPTASVLSIGLKTNKGEVAIIHHSITTKENTSYNVKGNILKVHSKFIEEGKTTISFAQPPHDLMIKANDVIQLKSFLGSIRSVLQGKELSKGGGGLSSLNAPVKVHRPKTTLVITSGGQYPVLEGFPRTLVHLQINGLERATFDSRILKLNLLKTLDLSNNKLKILPRGLGDLPNLSELLLANNDLGSAARQRGAWDWLRGPQLSKGLQLLDLRSNDIPALPSFIRDCVGLTTLKLDKNQLTILPSGIGKMSSLRELYASQNNLRFLPGSMKMMAPPLTHLDVSNNPFTGECITTQMITMKPLSLKELAARCVIAKKIFVSEAIIPLTVLQFMHGCDFCACGSACFNPAYSKIVYSCIGKIASSYTVSIGESTHKPFRMSICSDRCIRNKFADQLAS
ncbi:leucine-rich repeat protein 1 [Thrips palmi]|uniref:Leucine-rich repeat protein 1 n=1 Tax=Thrips palmi TaxID=161013 RepID=A0A6P9A4V3_THRPL|nr:leucine-rich repeat protein 1 [Thrips palmi]